MQSEQVETEDLTQLEITASPDSVDADGFVSLWNVASATMGKDSARARLLASRLLGFLCKHRCSFVMLSSTDAKYLDEWFERDASLLYDWSPESEKVDVLAQHAEVPLELLRGFLQEHKFDANNQYSPRRAARVEWFSNDWNIG